jgi:Helix-turn-helix domain
MNKPTQRDRIFNRLKWGAATNVQLNRICFRYGARIFELRRAGWPIETIPMGKGLCKYSLKP